MVAELGAWTARRCFPTPTDDQLDPRLLLWRIRPGLADDALPPRRVVIELIFDQDSVPERDG